VLDFVKPFRAGRTSVAFADWQNSNVAGKIGSDGFANRLRDHHRMKVDGRERD
jgi:hypothetical protein